MSSKRRIRRKSCSRKVRHASREAASTAMRRLLRTKGNEGRPLSVYACSFCGGWHFGHSPSRH